MLEALLHKPNLAVEGQCPRVEADHADGHPIEVEVSEGVIEHEVHGLGPIALALFGGVGDDDGQIGGAPRREHAQQAGFTDDFAVLPPHHGQPDAA